MVTLEQFLVVSLVVLLTVIVACGIAAVVLLKKAVDTEKTRKTRGVQKNWSTGAIGQWGKGIRADQGERSTSSSPKTSPKQARVTLGNNATQSEFLYERAALIHRIYGERHLEEHERYVQMHIEMLAALRELDIDVSGVETNELHDEKTPTITATDAASLTKGLAAHARFLADQGSVGRKAGRSGLTREGGGPIHGGAPA